MAWQKTKVQFLLKNSESGRYYARIYKGGKESWKSLKTDVFSVAQARLAVEIKDIRQAARNVETVEKGRGTVENLAGVYLDGVRKGCIPEASEYPLPGTACYGHHKDLAGTRKFAAKIYY